MQDHGSSGAHEEEPTDLEVGIRISGLTKVYNEVYQLNHSKETMLYLYYTIQLFISLFTLQPDYISAYHNI